MKKKDSLLIIIVSSIIFIFLMIFLGTVLYQHNSEFDEQATESAEEHNTIREEEIEENKENEQEDYKSFGVPTKASSVNIDPYKKSNSNQ